MKGECECKGLGQNNNPDHKRLSPRLNRIMGQLQGVHRMIERKEYCIDILNQLRAIQSAIRSFEAEVLQTHLEQCVQSAFHSGNREDAKRKVDEIIKVFKKRMR